MEHKRIHSKGALVFFTSILSLGLSTSCNNAEDFDYTKVSQRLNSFCYVSECERTEVRILYELGEEKRLSVKLVNPRFFDDDLDKAAFAKAIAFGMFTEMEASDVQATIVGKVEVELDESGTLRAFQNDEAIVGNFKYYVDETKSIMKGVRSRQWDDFRMRFHHKEDSLGVIESDELIGLFQSLLESCGNYTEYELYQLSEGSGLINVELILFRTTVPELLLFTYDTESRNLQGIQARVFCDI